MPAACTRKCRPQRAREVGSIHHILSPERLRPYLIEAVERGMEKGLARLG